MWFDRHRDVAGVVSATTGNHGQSVAYAGRAAGVPVTIVVPPGNNPDKNAAMRGFGAEVIEAGHDYQSAREYAEQLAADTGRVMVPPFTDELALGVATYALELFTAVTDLDVVYVPVGMGSGICGVIGARDAARPDDRGRRRGGRGAPATACPSTPATSYRRRRSPPRWRASPAARRWPARSRRSSTAPRASCGQ